MNGRDPAALARLSFALSPAAERVRAAAAAAALQRSRATAIGALPRLSLWVAVLTVGTGCLVAWSTTCRCGPRGAVQTAVAPTRPRCMRVVTASWISDPSR